MKKILNKIISLAKTANTLPTETSVPGLFMIQGDVPAHQLAALYKPMIGFTIQGTKILSIGGQSTTLKGPSYFVLPLHVPVTGSVRSESDQKPYMSLGLEINHEILQDLLKDLEEDLLLTSVPKKFTACKIDEDHMDAWLRLLQLTKTKKDVQGLAPPYKREILYRVLVGPQGWYLRQLGKRESPFFQISETVRWLRRNYAKPFNVTEAASKAGMATNTFHRQFKIATGLSPIQFQKQLRLIEARNRIAFEGYAVAEAAYEVGYQSPSQFNREYARLFGESPAKDTAKLRKFESERM